MTEPANIIIDTSMLPLFAQLGFDPMDVMRHAGLPPELLTQPNVHLTLAQYRALWVALETLAADPTFVIELGKLTVSGSFHAISFAALCASDLRTAAERVRDYKRLIAPETLELRDDDGEFTVVWKWDDPDANMPVSEEAMAAVFMTELARVGSRAQIVPTRVIVSEPLSHPGFAEYFGVVPEEGSSVQLSFRGEDAALPFLTVNEAMWEIFEPEIQQRLSRLGARAPAAVRVREHLLECLPAGEASADNIAERMGLSRRTLQRRLADEDCVFRDIVQEVREELSQHYLRNTELSYGEIAFLVGYDDASSFFRAFSRWTGTTPERMRVASG